MFSIILLGTGNVAHHLFDAFLNEPNIKIKQVYGRNKDALAFFSEKCDTTSNPKTINDADLFIIAVSDDAIATISALLSNKKGLVVHTSGSAAMKLLSNKRKGVFYPLQTFTKKRKIDFSKIPIGIEAENRDDLKIIKKFAKIISDNVYEISSVQREKLHLAAVFVNNFTNHMYSIGNEICSAEGLPFDLLMPLIKETVDKLQFLPPGQAQTGPANRNDLLTMQKHMQHIKNPIQKEIYQLISQSIKIKNEEKL